MKRKWPAAAKLVGAGTTAPTVYVRDYRGRWVQDSICDDAGGRDAVRRYEEVVAWARGQGAQRALRAFRAGLGDWNVFRHSSTPREVKRAIREVRAVLADMIRQPLCRPLRRGPRRKAARR